MSKYTWSWVTCAFNSLGSRGLIILYNGERAREIEKRNKNRQGEEEKREEVAEAAVTRRARGHVYFSKTLVIKGKK